MLPIIVRVDHEELGRVRDIVVEDPNVRIGRNSQNELHLPWPFVSAWHGMLRFADEAIFYVDLGSSNGTLVGDDLVTGGQEIQVPLDAEIRIGPVTLTFLQHGQEDVPRAPASSYGDPGASHDESPEPQPSYLSGPSRSEDIAHIAGSLLPWLKDPGSPDEVATLLARCVGALEIFCSAFVDLRRGHHEFGKQTGITTLRGLGALHRSDDPAEVLAYLLGDDPRGNDRLAELQGLFDDVRMHPIAVLDGMRAGVRVLLKALSSEELDIHIQSDKSWPRGKDKARWETCQQLLQEFMTDESTLWAIFFGREFARAYASAAGQRTSEDQLARGHGRTEVYSSASPAPESPRSKVITKPLPAPPRRPVPPVANPRDRMPAKDEDSASRERPEVSVASLLETGNLGTDDDPPPPSKKPRS